MIESSDSFCSLEFYWKNQCILICRHDLVIYITFLIRNVRYIAYNKNQ